MKQLNFIKIFFYSVMLFATPSLLAQKINTDSLLTEVIKDINVHKNYPEAIKKAQMGIKAAPDYLDFHLFLGRAYQLTESIDSARYHYKIVVEKNPKYEDAYTYWSQLETNAKNYPEATRVTDQAIAQFPQNKSFYFRKLAIYELQKEDDIAYDYLKSMDKQFPNDTDIKQRLFLLERKNNNDRVGLNYSITFFDRNGVGPWNLGSAQYIRERKWGSLIGRVNYANRLSFKTSIADGLQYEAESYFFTGKKAYSYAGVAYSDDIVFPKWRLGYSFYYNFNNGWEADLGVRYTKTVDEDLTAAVVGIGKYLGSYWINLRTFLQNQNSKVYPAFTLTTRYYFDSRFDYATLMLGYGTSPDERSVLGQLEQRIAMDSYRIGAGYYRVLWQNYLAGIQVNYNNQEYLPGQKQNETEINFSLQYRF
ncbi:YaiO family outer membrane beta-barrel protein [Flavobacterium cerinum]|uniref:YaiO family outer membrane beta-barrel protein n=1 Tax=Flavobacterium cerinum TaxID=2502784 RepID=A0ABY5IRI0_9FLAO|nr:YaiO family outer membrane beta-barrel protein [Flavobacterium cerinum]UUC45448.1 YaiO family outer membrane beta-barrel protein [Flavobacterium cerinum]